jgi:V/A-type H+-transporting ATPase subunit I
VAIERMKIIWLFDPRAGERELLDRLAAMGLSHVTRPDLPPEAQHERLGVRRVYPDLGDLERRVQLLRDTLDVLARFSKTSRDFFQNFIATPVEVTSEEVRAALKGLDEAALHHEARDLDRCYAALSGSLERAREARKALSPMAGLEFAVPGEDAGKWTRGWAGQIGVDPLHRLLMGEKLPESCVISEEGRIGRTRVVQAAALEEDAEGVLAALREHGFEPLEPEKKTLPFSEYYARRHAEVKRVAAELAGVDERLRAFAAANRRRVEVALGYWEERLNIAGAAAMLARSRRLTMFKGYVRERELAAFQDRVAKELPEAVVLVREPEPAKEEVPVSLRNPKFFRPASFLVSMFGLPKYTTFDPTPVIFFSFLLFFGCCFGDVLYGIFLVAFGVALSRKYRGYPGLRDFFMLLAYAGVPTIIVGALTGAWAGDLLQMLSEGNPIRRLSEMLTVADPVSKVLTLLVLVLFIGIANQMLALVMLMVKNIKAGDWVAAIFDSAFWLLLLPGFTILVAGTFVKLAPALQQIGWGMCIAGAVGLVLTQGRAEKSLIGKIGIGIVSLYGIVGTYGITSYIGDTLSYSRLLALGLTTGIVALSFNMIAKMSGDIPYVGPVFLVLVLLLGHALNFVVSILGGFVHSARLTFVEFFGRFYDGGATPFRPLGGWHGRIRVTDRETVWPE